MDKVGLIIGVIGGCGLGLLIGSEFSGSIATILGAIVVMIALLLMGILSFKENK